MDLPGIQIVECNLLAIRPRNNWLKVRYSDVLMPVIARGQNNSLEDFSRCPPENFKLNPIYLLRISRLRTMTAYYDCVLCPGRLLIIRVCSSSLDWLILGGPYKRALIAAHHCGLRPYIDIWYCRNPRARGLWQLVDCGIIIFDVTK